MVCAYMYVLCICSELKFYIMNVTQVFLMVNMKLLGKLFNDSIFSLSIDILLGCSQKHFRKFWGGGG